MYKYIYIYIYLHMVYANHKHGQIGDGSYC